MIASLFVIFYQLWFWRRRFNSDVKAITYEGNDAIESSVDPCVQRLTIKVDENSSEICDDSKDGASRDQFASPESGFFSPGNSITMPTVDGSDGGATSGLQAPAAAAEIRSDSLGGTTEEQDDDESFRSVVDRLYSPGGSSSAHPQNRQSSTTECLLEDMHRGSREESGGIYADDDQERERKTVSGELSSPVRGELQHERSGRRRTQSELDASLLETKGDKSANCEHEGDADEARVAMQAFGLQLKGQRSETSAGHRQDGGDNSDATVLTGDDQPHDTDEDTQSSPYKSGVENGEFIVETDSKAVDKMAAVDLMESYGVTGEDLVVTKLQQSSSGAEFQEQDDARGFLNVSCAAAADAEQLAPDSSFSGTRPKQSSEPTMRSPSPSAPPAFAEETDEELAVRQSVGNKTSRDVDQIETSDADVIHPEGRINEILAGKDYDQKEQDTGRKLVIAESGNQVRNWAELEQGLLTPISDQVVSMIGALNADYDSSELSFGRSQSIESQLDFDDVELEKLTEKCDANDEYLASKLKETQAEATDGKFDSGEALLGTTDGGTLSMQMQEKVRNHSLDSRGETMKEEYGVEMEELGDTTPTPGCQEFNFSEYSSETTHKKNSFGEAEGTDIDVVVDSGKNELKQREPGDEINEAETEQGGETERTPIGEHLPDVTGANWNLEDVKKQIGDELHVNDDDTKNEESGENDEEEEENWSVMVNRDDGEEATSIRDFEEDDGSDVAAVVDSDLEITIPSEVPEWDEMLNEMTPRIAEKSADSEFEYTPTESRMTSAAAAVAAAFDVEEAGPEVKVDWSEGVVDEEIAAQSMRLTEKCSEFQSYESSGNRIDLTDGEGLENVPAAEARQNTLHGDNNELVSTADIAIAVLICPVENSENQSDNSAEGGKINLGETDKPAAKPKLDLISIMVPDQQNREGKGEESARSPRSPRSPRLFDRPARPILTSNVVEYTNKAFEKTAIHRSISSERRYLHRVLEDTAEVETGLEESIGPESRRTNGTTEIQVVLGHNRSELEIISDKELEDAEEDGKVNLYSTEIDKVGSRSLETEVNETDAVERLLAEENRRSEGAELQLVGSDLDGQSHAGSSEISAVVDQKLISSAPEVDSYFEKTEAEVTAVTREVSTEIRSIETVDDLAQQFSSLRFEQTDGRRDGVAGRADGRAAQNVDTLALQLSGLDLERGQNENANKLTRQFNDLKLIGGVASEGSDENQMEKLEVPVEKASNGAESAKSDIKDVESVPSAAVNFDEVTVSFVMNLAEQPPSAVQKLDEQIEETESERMSGERQNAEGSSETFYATHQPYSSPLSVRRADNESLLETSTTSPGERHVSKATMEIKPPGSSTKKSSGLPTLGGTTRPVDDKKFSLVRIRRQLPTATSEDATDAAAAAKGSSTAAAASEEIVEIADRNEPKSTTERTPSKSPSSPSLSSSSWLASSASAAAAAVGTTTMTTTVRTIRSPKSYRLSSNVGASLQEDPRDLRDNSLFAVGRSTERTSLTFSPDTESRSITVRRKPKHRPRPEISRLPVRATDQFGADFDAVDDDIFTAADKPDKETLQRVYRGRSKSEHMDDTRFSLKLDDPLAELQDMTLPNVRRMTELFSMQQRPPPSSKIPRRPYISRTPPPSAFIRRHHDESEFTLIDQSYSPDTRLSIVRQNRRTSSGDSGDASLNTTPRRSSSAIGFKNLNTC